MFFIFGILMSFSFVLAYTQSYYSSQNNNVLGLGIFSSGQSLKVDDSMCQQGDDFLIQIGPLACTPSPVRSDLLEEENVNVFCQMTATQINPFVDVQRIDEIGFQREYPPEVVGIGYQPAQSALGYTYNNLEGSLLLQNLGYVVITLRKQPNESALTNCKKDALGSDICWVEGNLTANLRYDVQNVFGVGQAVFYLPVMDDAEWEKNYIPYSFWEGRGYLRANSVGENDAVLSVYSDNSVASSLLAAGRKYTLARYSSNIPLKVGATSDKIFLPGLSPCLASLQLRLEGVVNPDTRAVIKVNEDYSEVALDETFLEGKCKVSDMTKNGVTSKVKITCSGADSVDDRKPFELTISPRVNLSINGVKKDYGVGDLLYKSSDKYVYLGYVGSTGDSSDVSKLYATLVALPPSSKDGDVNKLTDSEISSVASWSETAMSSSDSGIGSVDFVSNAFNKFVSTSMYVGKAVLNGENFVNIPYIGVVSAPKVFQGTSVSLGGFFSGMDDGTFSLDNQNFTNAMSDFGTVVNNYPNEVEKANSVQSLGEKAFYEKIYLTNALGMKKTVNELCSEFEQSYPDTYLNTGICTNIVKLASNFISIKEITVNGITKEISFDGIKEPSKNDYSAEVLVQGPNGKVLSYVLEKNKVVSLTGFRTDADQKNLTTTEYIKLVDLSTTSATVRVNVAGKTTLENILVSDNKLLNKGQPEPYGGYTLTLKNVNLNKVAKVSVISNQDLAKSNSTFNFKIGIEKRAIQLSPEKAQEKIIAENKSIADLQKISNSLYTVVKTMKAACTATGVILTAKNFIANANGKAIARQTVMGKTGSGGWNDKCAKLVPKTYKTLDACFLHFSDEIEKEVDNTNKIIQLQNTEIANLEKTNGGSSDNSGFIGGYSKNVAASLNSANVNQALSSLTDAQKKNLDLDKIKGILNSGTSYTDYYSKNAYTLDQLKQIELDSSYINQYGSDSNDQTVINAKSNLISVLSNVYVNSNKYIEENTFEGETGMTDNTLVGSFDKLVNMKQIPTDASKRILFKNTPYKNIDTTGSLTDVKVSDSDYAYAIEDTSRSPAKKYIVRYNADGVVVQTYEIIPATTITQASLKVYIGNDGKNNPNPFSLQFQKYDAASYKNPFKASYGSSTPLIRYFETVPYKGKPAVVPFDLKNGWYAGINSPQTSYDASGRVVSFWLCNVGEDGIEQFQLENFGGDTCVLFNLNTGQTLSNFPGYTGDTKALVDKAKNAIEQAQRAYKEGVTSVNGIKVGEPPSQSSASQCTDFMSASDCNILFNVCDPVVCPSSRCNLGGNYPVTNVIQSGIIGSIALCYPNAKWNGGDIYVPVCLSGIQTGLDNWISIEKSYRDCLQTSIDTGATVGVCDEINSIYTCEFFWKQSLPIIKYAMPKILGKVTGQSGKGGGEYQGITSALDSVKKSIDYFKQYYAANSYNAFKVRSTEQVGTELCGSFISAIYPDSGSFLDNLITPDSPVQFTGKFDEIPLTTATNPPTSQYKVYYHIYAGKDTGVYYTVYLRGSGSSYYQDTAQNRLVKSGYIAKGESADETPDFTAPSGYQQLCIVVNGQEECGFKEVSTSFAVNYLSDLYLAQEASNTSIKTQDECISGTTSLYNILNLNVEAAANNLINPQIYAQGIIRICATSDPGVGTDVNAGTENARWRKVGICGQTGIGCWIDTDSVKNVIKTMNIENAALNTITNASLQYLNSSDYLTLDQFNAKMADINAAGVTSQQKIDMITDIINKVYYSNQKAQLFYNRGKAYSELAIAEYNVLVTAKQAAAVANTTTANGETISPFDKTYVSPIFEFQDGTSQKNVCYRYFNSNWHWMMASTGSGSAIIPNCNDPNFPNGRKWIDTTVFKDEIGQVPGDKSVAFINLLQGQLYLSGLTLLVKRTIANNEGGILSADLVAGDSQMSDTGVFTVKFNGNSVYFKYADSAWSLSADNKVWYQSSNYNGGIAAINEIASYLVGQDSYQGAAVLFDPTSSQVKDFFKKATAGGGNTEAALESSFARRDVVKLTSLMQELSTMVFQSSFKCYCGDTCGNYASWLNEASGTQGIPDELLLLAIMIQESSCKSVESSGGDLGLMQINTIHCGANGLPLSIADCQYTLLNDNEKNINVGAQILKDDYTTSSRAFVCTAIAKSYSGWEAALRGYNGWGCTGDNNYVEDVEAKYYQLVNLYNGNSGTTGTATCTDTCSSLGYQCGTQTVCGQSADCGACPSGQSCNSTGKCVTITTAACTTGQIKCEGTTYFTCVNNAWVSQGLVDGKCTYTAPTGVCTAPQPYSQVASLTDARQKVLFAATALDGTPALKGSIIKDYDLSGGINCFDSTLHVYNKAGVTYHCAYSDDSGKAYTSDVTTVLMGVTKNSAGSVLFQINPSKCDTHGLSEKDKLNNIKPGDILSIVWNPTAGHSVIFIKWIDVNSHTNAQVFDWIGGFSYKTYDLSDGKHSVYMYWDPVNQ